MSVESPSYGLPNWPLPSPSATPRSCVSQQRQFETPSAESPSFFADAYYTPSIKGQQTPALTPVSTSSAAFCPRSVNSALSPDDPKFHKNISATSTLPLPPVDPSKRLSSSPNPQDEASTFAKEGLQVDLKGLEKMDPYQLQTPPPGDGQRHPHTQHQNSIASQPFGQGLDSTNTPIRQQSMNFNGQNLHTPTYQSSFQQSLSLATDMYQYHNAPASAPPIPQSRFMWDQSPQMPNFDHRIMQVEQPQFGTPNTMLGQWQNQELSPQMHGGFPQQSHHGLPHPGHDSDFWLSSSMASQPTPSAYTSETSFLPPTSGVNPNLVFSFSSPVQTINPTSVGSLYPPPVIDSASRQPYEQQNRASTQEKELAKKSRQNQQPQQVRLGSTLGPDSRPALQRSNTDSGFRRKSRQADVRTALQVGESISRRESPLKRHSQISLTSIAEAPTRSSKLRTRLVIDASGTARTETVIGDEDKTWSRRRSSHLLDEDSSEEEPVLTSQRNSFAFNPDLLRPTKHSRNDSDDEDGGLYKRPLSSTSLSSLTSRMGSTPLGRKVSMDTHNRASHGPDYASFLSDLASSSQDTVLGNNEDDSDTGDAQSALKRLVGGRSRRDFCDPNATLKPRRAATNPVRSSGMIDITKFPSPPSPPITFDRPSSNNTPTTDRSTRSADSTRCVCGVNEDLGNSPVVQCESCANFLHVRCVFGKRAEERGVKLPRVYVCAYCTGQTRLPSNPLVPGQHFQGQDSGFGTSPLGYKSSMFM